MPAKKPLSEHRVSLSVTCSKNQKKQINRVLAKVSKGVRSQYILQLLKEAIAANKTEIADEMSYSHNTNVQFQVSCTRQEKKLIDDFCKTYLTSRKRSRWIVKVLLSATS